MQLDGRRMKRSPSKSSLHVSNHVEDRVQNDHKLGGC